MNGGVMSVADNRALVKRVFDEVRCSMPGPTNPVGAV
jgi:hypothetical protein